MNQVLAQETVRLTRQRKNGREYTYYRHFTADGYYIKKYPAPKKVSEYPFSRLNRQRCLERDNFTCQHCGAKDNLDVHHKDEKSLWKVGKDANNSLPNLITLCDPCRQLLHHWKRDRNQAVIDYANSHPGYALSEIARFFNLSRQRVFVILKKAG